MAAEGKFEIEQKITFDANKQLAILGWGFKDPAFFAQLAFSMKPESFGGAYTQKVYGAMLKIFNKYNRVPSVEEIRTYRDFTLEEAKAQVKIQEVIDSTLRLRDVHHLDLLRTEMTEWMHSTAYYQSVHQSALLYNSKKTEEAWKVLEAATLFKTTSTFEDGANEGFRLASERIHEERAERLAQSKRTLKFGVDFLDDILGGIIPNDLIVIGAKTGAGKTQLATSIALYNAEHSKPDSTPDAFGNFTETKKFVHYLALEAENCEIERRIKYGYLSDYYHLKDPDHKNHYICYTDWRHGNLEHIFGDLEESPEVMDPVTKIVGRLKTLYRTSGTFDLKALEKSLLNCVTESKLIVIDHLHYIDTDDASDENAGYKKTIKLIRDIVLKYGVPIVVIAHLRKGQGGMKHAPLICGVEDFHGSSDVPKIATTCIMLSKCADKYVAEKPYLWPTYIQVVKSRMEGSRTLFTGIVKFDARGNKYTPKYQLGRMRDFNTEFDPIANVNAPRWATHLDDEELKPVSGMGMEDDSAEDDATK